MRTAREKLHSTAVRFVSVTNKICAHQRVRRVPASFVRRFVGTHETHAIAAQQVAIAGARSSGARTHTHTPRQTCKHAAPTYSIASHQQKPLLDTTNETHRTRAHIWAFKFLNLCTIIILIVVLVAERRTAERAVHAVCACASSNS